MADNVTRANVTLDAHTLVACNTSQSLPELSSWWRGAILISYLATFVFGFAGNSLVVYIIAYYKSVRTKSVANYYIWNLSFADLFFVLTLPFFCYSTFFQDWPFGTVVCKLAYAIRETNRFASVFTLVALSIDRYIASFYSLWYLRTLRIGQIVCVLIWLMCLGISIPYWLYSFVHTSPDNSTSCRFAWPIQGRVQRDEMWTYFRLFAALIVPCVLIFGSYILLGLRLRALYKKSCRQESCIQKPSRRMTRTVIVVVVIFVVCQTPYHALTFLSLHKVQKASSMAAEGRCYVPDENEYTVFVTVNAFAQMLVFLSSCCNPVIYGLLNDNYRKLYTTVMCRCRRQQGLQEAGSCDSDQPPEMASGKVTYRFEITFHLPCTHPPVPIRNRRRVPSTENMELEDKSLHLLATNMINTPST